MSVMRVAGGTPAESFASFPKGHRKPLAIGVGIALFAHAAILIVVLQAKGARTVFEPASDKSVVMDFPPIYREPSPPPMKTHPAKADKAPATPLTPQPPVQTRAADARAATSELTAEPQGTLGPTAGTDPNGPPTPPAQTQTPPKADPVIRAADWARRPTGADMAKFYPDRAQRLGVEGQTVLSCAVSLEGAAQNCRIVRESPASMDFGDAALRMAKSFRFKPMLVDGQPKADGPIQIPLSWRLQ